MMMKDRDSFLQLREEIQAEVSPRGLPLNASLKTRMSPTSSNNAMPFSLREALDSIHVPSVSDVAEFVLARDDRESIASWNVETILANEEESDRVTSRHAALVFEYFSLVASVSPSCAATSQLSQDDSCRLRVTSRFTSLATKVLSTIRETPSDDDDDDFSFRGSRYPFVTGCAETRFLRSIAGFAAGSGGDGASYARIFSCLAIEYDLRRLAAADEIVSADVREGGKAPTHQLLLLRDVMIRAGATGRLSANVLHVLWIMAGSPRGLNLRNITMHGFLQPEAVLCGLNCGYLSACDACRATGVITFALMWLAEMTSSAAASLSHKHLQQFVRWSPFGSSDDLSARAAALVVGNDACQGFCKRHDEEPQRAHYKLMAPDDEHGSIDVVTILVSFSTAEHMLRCVASCCDPERESVLRVEPGVLLAQDRKHFVTLHQLLDPSTGLGATQTAFCSADDAPSLATLVASLRDLCLCEAGCKLRDSLAHGKTQSTAGWEHLAAYTVALLSAVSETCGLLLGFATHYRPVAIFQPQIIYGSQQAADRALHKLLRQVAEASQLVINDSDVAHAVTSLAQCATLSGDCCVESSFADKGLLEENRVIFHEGAVHCRAEEAAVDISELVKSLRRSRPSTLSHSQKMAARTGVEAESATESITTPPPVIPVHHLASELDRLLAAEFVTSLSAPCSIDDLLWDCHRRVAESLLALLSSWCLRLRGLATRIQGRTARTTHRDCFKQCCVLSHLIASACAWVCMAARHELSRKRVTALEKRVGALTAAVLEMGPAQLAWSLIALGAEISNSNLMCRTDRQREGNE
jgi:hypothetical protein